MRQPIGFPVPGWKPVPRPSRAVLEGRYCRLEPLAPRHAPAMFAALADDREGTSYTYLGYEPFADEAAVCRLFEGYATSDDPLFFAILLDGACTGIASLLRIDPEVGVVEVGHIHYAPRLQRTRAATEAMYLLMRAAFQLGYRRYEWKCDALNAPSRRAAERLGFTYEGTFRQARVYKGRNRDTAWYAMIDREWPALAAEYERWLDSANFDASGRQRTALDTARALRSSPEPFSAAREGR